MAHVREPQAQVREQLEHPLPGPGPRPGPDLQVLADQGVARVGLAPEVYVARGGGIGIARNLGAFARQAKAPLVDLIPGGAL